MMGLKLFENPLVRFLIRCYLGFAISNTIYKLYYFRRIKMIQERNLRYLPVGRFKKSVFGFNLIKNLHRMNDYLTEVMHEFPEAPLIRAPLPGDPILLQTPEAVEWMLNQEFKSVTKGNEEQGVMYTVLRQFLGEGIFTLRHGDKNEEIAKEHKLWYSTRKTASKIFTKKEMMVNMQETFIGKSKLMIDALNESVKKGEVVDMQAKFFAFTMDSIQQLFFGKSVNTMKDGVTDIYATQFDLSHRNFFETSFSTIPFQLLSLLIFPYPFGTLTVPGDVTKTWFYKAFQLVDKSYQNFQHHKSLLHNVVEKYIAEIRNDPSISTRKDMIANFLNSESTKNMTDEQLRDVVLNLTIAGRDTTACTLSWLFYLLTQNPRCQEKLCQEIDEKLKGNTPTLADLDPNNMPYLNGVLYEALRLFPAVPLDEKFASRDLEYLDGTKIAAGSRLIFAPYAMGRNPTVYKQPHNFDPTRWIPFKTPNAFAFPVFQAGPRFCLGKDMAQFEAKLLTAMLLQKFTFSMEDSEAEKITYSRTLTMAICNSPNQDSHNLWITPHPRKV